MNNSIEIKRTAKFYHPELNEAFGRSRWYPRCKFSDFLCSITGRTTLTDEQIDLIKKYGYSVEEVDE